MDILFIIIGILCLLTGLAGCFLPVIPGPPVAYAGLLLLHFTDKVQYSTTPIIAMAAARHHFTGARLFHPHAGQQI